MQVPKMKQNSDIGELKTDRIYPCEGKCNGIWAMENKKWGTLSTT
jgi:hypothetical protein